MGEDSYPSSYLASFLDDDAFRCVQDRVVPHPDVVANDEALSAHHGDRAANAHELAKSPRAWVAIAIDHEGSLQDGKTASDEGHTLPKGRAVKSFEE
jgi:hypothetical protein